jgi:hypothetical protein
MARGDRSGEALLASTSPLLNSAREIKLKFSERAVRIAADSAPHIRQISEHVRLAAKLVGNQF